MKITCLTTQNVKRLTAVEIKPDGSLVVVGGQNRAGKSSVLDSIMYVLAGVKSIPDRPIRDGAKSGTITVELDGERKLIVTRRLTTSGGSLEIRMADGSKASSPQTILDELCGKIAFDPLAFTRLKPLEQAAMLRELVGLDFTAADARRHGLYDERTLVNREVKSLAAQLEATPADDTAPKEEVSVADLMTELETAQITNRERANAIQVAAEAGQVIAELFREAKAITVDIENLRRQVRNATDKLEANTKDRKKWGAEATARRLTADAKPTVECQPILDRINSAEGTNQKVRGNRERNRIVTAHTEAHADSDELTYKIEQIDDDKQRAMSEAKWPVDGLGFNEAGVTMNSLPFEQASSAEALRVSVAIGLALNPELPVLLIRDGSLLDESSLRMLAEMAEAKEDGQVWVERAGEGAECSVIIEDGHVKAEAEDPIDAVLKDPVAAILKQAKNDECENDE